MGVGLPDSLPARRRTPVSKTWTPSPLCKDIVNPIIDQKDRDQSLAPRYGWGKHDQSLHIQLMDSAEQPM